MPWLHHGRLCPGHYPAPRKGARIEGGAVSSAKVPAPPTSIEQPYDTRFVKVQMQKTPETEQFSDGETKKRMEDAIRRAMNTPHEPHAKRPAKAAPKRKRKPSAKA